MAAREVSRSSKSAKKYNNSQPPIVVTAAAEGNAPNGTAESPTGAVAAQVKLHAPEFWMQISFATQIPAVTHKPESSLKVMKLCRTTFP